MLEIEQYPEAARHDAYAETARRGSELQFRRLLEKLPAGAYTCDPQGLITYFNSHAVHLWGREPKLNDPVDRFCGSFKLISANDGVAIRHDQCWMALALQTGNEYNGHEIIIERPDGQRLTVLAHANPIRSDSGHLVGAMNVLVDISERKRTEDVLKEADRCKNEFLATLAHELRNPLAPIYNAVRILQSDDTAAVDQKWAVDVIDRQTKQMTRLIDDLLDVGRINANLLQLRKERIELAALIRTAVETSQPLIEASGQTLSVTTPPQAVYLDADQTRLAQVVANLLNNAAKYTERGGRLRLRAEQNGGEVIITVGDSGIGISSKSLPHIFEMFMQVPRAADAAANWAQSGLGVGLTLAKRLVAMHGGSIAAYSEGLGKGSEFIVRLPCISPASPPAAIAEPASAAAVRSLHILVVDDNPDTAISMGMLLQLMGHEIRTAHDGLEAVHVAEQFRPDVVLLDIGLPLADGYRAAEMIRGQPWGKEMVLIAVTGWGQEADKRRTAAAGFNHHLVKPVDPAALTQLLAAVQPRRH